VRQTLTYLDALVVLVLGLRGNVALVLAVPLLELLDPRNDGPRQPVERRDLQASSDAPSLCCCPFRVTSWFPASAYNTIPTLSGLIVGRMAVAASLAILAAIALGRV
jgi:hypothetical protein